MPEVMKRREALRRGLRTYFTGKPCKHGHITERNSKSGLCAGCNRMRAQMNYSKDPERIRAWQRDNPEKLKEYGKRYRARKTAEGAS